MTDFALSPDAHAHAPSSAPPPRAAAIAGCAVVFAAAALGLVGARLMATVRPASAPVHAVTLAPAAPAVALTQSEPRTMVVREGPAVAAGVIRGSLYESALAAGATPGLVAAATRLFSRSLDFARDLHPGDSFRLVFDREAAGDLLYAEVTADGRARRFYRFAHGGRVDYVDEIGASQKALLLKTPLDGAHVTSTFGLRLHPLLGYTRLHPGIDFGAPTGTPVFAAGDGVVQEARWAGGYGHWLKLAHAGGWATGYGHLSRYAAGVRPGARVVQGQVVAYVGSTGLSTGPHLHYEVMRGGAKLNPLTAKLPTGSVLSRADVARFAAEKRRIDGLLAEHPAQVALLALRPHEGA